VKPVRVTSAIHDGDRAYRHNMKMQGGFQEKEEKKPKAGGEAAPAQSKCIDAGI